MAKPNKSTAVTTKAKASTKVTLKSPSGLPSYLAETKMTGAGVSTDASDNLIPMARVLQKLSPEVDKRNGAAYIAGAEEGDIIVKNAPNPIIKGEDGFLFQPCYFQKGFVEWVPRGKGGGFVTMHKEEPTDTVSKPNPENEERSIRVRKSNGNLIVETRYHGGFIIIDGEAPQAAVLPFSSSGHSVSKAWMMLMNRKMVEGAKADSFAVYYRFKTALRTKDKNNWHVFEITDAGEEDADTGLPTTYWAPTEEDYLRGKSLSDSLAGGTKSFDAAEGAGDAVNDETKM